MKRAYKSLLLLFSIFFVTVFSAIEMRAQSNLHSEFEGTWVLDSVQITEIMPDGNIQKTLLPNEYCEFNSYWIQQFTLNSSGVITYTKTGNHTISNAPCIIKNKDGVMIMTIGEALDYQALEIRPISNTRLLVDHAFCSNMFWKLYYHKSN